MDTDDYTSPIPEEAIAKAAALTAQLMDELPTMNLRCLAHKTVQLFFCPCISCDGTCGYGGVHSIHDGVVTEVMQRAETIRSALSKCRQSLTMARYPAEVGRYRFDSEIRNLPIVTAMSAIPRYRRHAGPAILAAGFRPFFLGGAIWAVLAIPLWLAAYADGFVVPSLLPPVIWHVHEMVFGFAAAIVAGFLLTAIPNWTGRMPLQGGPLAMLVSLWAIGRLAVLFSGTIGAPAAATADLSFPLVFLLVVAREILAGKNWRNLPTLGVLALLLIGNLLIHLEALGVVDTAALGNRVGLVTLLMLISLVGGRIIPSFTLNWLRKIRPEIQAPAPQGRADHAVLTVTGVALATWAVVPDAPITSWAVLVAGIAAAWRLSRWRGLRTAAEPLLLILHIGYAWLAFGLLLLGADGLYPVLPQTAVLHALTVGAVGTMTLSVMTRVSLGHTGRPLTAGSGTRVIYTLITLAAVLRILSPLAGDQVVVVLTLAGAAWTAAFGLFAILYGGVLSQPRAQGGAARPI